MECKTNKFEPIYDENSEILILGTFPGVKSLKTGFYYADTRNKFWSIISNITGESQCNTREEKIKMLLDNKIAIWDVLESCDRKGSADSSITNIALNDLSIVINNSNIKRIYANGKKAESYYNKYQRDITGMEITYLPSTSGSNTKFANKINEMWSVIKNL